MDTMEIVFPGGKRVDAKYKGFTIKTDQPVSLGGEGTAPTPFELFLASIGTCTAVYVLSFCQKRGIPTENIKLILKKEVNEETDTVTKISIEIQVPKDFPENYKGALIKVAEKCKVKKHIEDSPPKFEIYTATL